MRHVVHASILICLLFASAGQAEPLICPDPQLSVQADSAEQSETVCAQAGDVLDRFRSCGLTLERPIRIELTDELNGHCLGIYHCGKDHIELLRPDRFEAHREADSAFAMLDSDTYYTSVLAHELAHAIYDPEPCPFDSCLANSEYLAYTMQIYSLDRDAQAAFEAGITYDRRISRDELSAMMLLLAPDIFARKAWLHFTQRDDPCAFIADIMIGDVLLDYEHP